MSDNTLKFKDVIVIKKEFYASKQSIALSLVDANKIVVSDKCDHRVNGSKYFIGNFDDDNDNIIRFLRILLPRSSVYIKYFDDGKNMCHLKLKIIMYIYHTLKFGTKLKEHQIQDFIVSLFMMVNT